MYYKVFTLLFFLLMNRANSQPIIESNRVKKISINQLYFSLLKATSSLIVKENTKPDRDAVMLLNYINNHYKTNVPHPTLNPYLNKIVLNSENLRIMGKWFNPNFKLEKAAYTKNLHSLDSLMIASLYCKEYELPDNFLQTIDSLSQKGGYYLTHACIYFQWAKLNGCLNNVLGSNMLKLRLEQNLLNYLRQTKELNDIDVEAIALLRFMNVETPESNDYISRVINNQMLDGGWQAFSNDKRSYDHTTALAFWTLIDESKKQNDTYTPFIDAKKLSPLELYTSYFLLSKLDSNLMITPFDSLFVSNKVDDNEIVYSGFFIAFNSAFDTLLNHYYEAKELPNLDSAIQNTNELSELFFYKSVFKKGNSNEILDNLLLEIQQKPKLDFKNYLINLLIRVTLSEKGLSTEEKKNLIKDSSSNLDPLSEFQKVVATFLTHYTN